MRGHASFLAVSLLSAAQAACAAPAAPAVSLSVPVECEIGVECLIQKYYDMDAGPGRSDHRCGAMTTDGHDGIDFRVRTRADMARGVAVVAAADGVVLRVRDGEPDISVKLRGSTGGRDAGNAVILRHSDGSETQYSHLRQGSVAVAPGQPVKAGSRLGLIGMSGNAEFPHLHFSLRIDGKEIDPFTARAAGSGCSPPATPPGSGFWSPAALRRLSYQDLAIVSAGVSSSVPPASSGERGESGVAAIATSEPIIFWIEAMGAKPGDRQRFRIRGPGGADVLNSETDVGTGGLSWFAYQGRKAPSGGWLRGSYQADYAIERAGRSPQQISVRFDVR